MASSKPSPAKRTQTRRPTTPGSSPSKVTKATKAAKEKRLSKTESAAILQAGSSKGPDRETGESQVRGGKIGKKTRPVEDSSSEVSTKTSRKPVPSRWLSGKAASPEKGPLAKAHLRSRSLSPGIDQKNMKESTPTKTSKRPSKASKNSKETWAYTHVPPRQDERRKNGRHEGRNLVVWTRPRMSDKLALHIQYELARHKIEVPWDAIAHRLHPGSSGSAILQYLNRLRGTLTAEGHLIPPPLPKPGSRQPADPTIRGYVRKDMDGSDATTTRPVPFSEPMEDRKFNLPDAFDHSQLLETPSPSKKRRANSGTRSVRGRKKVEPEQSSPDPADLDGDADYSPNVKASSVRRRLFRATEAKTYAEDKSDSDSEIEHASAEVNNGEDDGENDSEAAKCEGINSSEEESEAEEDEASSDDNVDMSDADDSDDSNGGDHCDEDDSRGEGNYEGRDEEPADESEGEYPASERPYNDEDEDMGMSNNTDDRTYAFANNATMNEPFPGTPVHMNPSHAFVNGPMLHNPMSSPMSFLPADIVTPSPATYYQPTDNAIAYLPQFNPVSSPGGFDHAFDTHGGPSIFDGTYADEDIDGEYEQLFQTSDGQYAQSMFIALDNPGS